MSSSLFKDSVGDRNILRARVKQMTFILRAHRGLLFILPILIFLRGFVELIGVGLVLAQVKETRT
ncbi:hypothetical protein ES702_00583 [subsurface metagenome]